MGIAWGPSGLLGSQARNPPTALGGHINLQGGTFLLLYRFFNTVCAMGGDGLPDADIGSDKRGFPACAESITAGGMLFSKLYTRSSVKFPP